MIEINLAKPKEFWFIQLFLEIITTKMVKEWFDDYLKEKEK